MFIKNSSAQYARRNDTGVTTCPSHVRRDKGEPVPVGGVEAGRLLEGAPLRPQREEDAVGDAVLQEQGREVRRSEEGGQPPLRVDEAEVAHPFRQEVRGEAALPALRGVGSVHPLAGEEDGRGEGEGNEAGEAVRPSAGGRGGGDAPFSEVGQRAHRVKATRGRNVQGDDVHRIPKRPPRSPGYDGTY
jgi:hypothetical protein